MEHPWRTFRAVLGCTLLACLAAGAAWPRAGRAGKARAVQAEGTSPATGVPEEALAPIAGVVDQAIRDHKCPGAVVLVGHQGQVVYRRAFGYRALVPTNL